MIQEKVFMQDGELNQEKFHTLIKFVSEISEMLNQISEQGKNNAALEEELAQLKRFAEESCAVTASLREQLANSNAEKELLSEQLRQEIQNRKRFEEESRAITTSLKEQLARRESEIARSKKKLQNEIHTLKPTLAFRSKFLLHSLPRKNKFTSTNRITYRH